MDHIRIQSRQHLRSGLPADATVHIRLAGKVFGEIPAICNGIAQEDDAPFDFWRFLEAYIVIVVAAQLVPVLELVRQTRRQ